MLDKLPRELFHIISTHLQKTSLATYTLWLDNRNPDLARILAKEGNVSLIIYAWERGLVNLSEWFCDMIGTPEALIWAYKHWGDVREEMVNRLAGYMSIEQLGYFMRCGFVLVDQALCNVAAYGQVEVFDFLIDMGLRPTRLTCVMARDVRVIERLMGLYPGHDFLSQIITANDHEAIEWYLDNHSVDTVSFNANYVNLDTLCLLHEKGVRRFNADYKYPISPEIADWLKINYGIECFALRGQFIDPLLGWHSPIEVFKKCVYDNPKAIPDLYKEMMNSERSESLIMDGTYEHFMMLVGKLLVYLSDEEKMTFREYIDNNHEEFLMEVLKRDKPKIAEYLLENYDCEFLSKLDAFEIIDSETQIGLKLIHEGKIPLDVNAYYQCIRYERVRTFKQLHYLDCPYEERVFTALLSQLKYSDRSVEMILWLDSHGYEYNEVLLQQTLLENGYTTLLPLLYKPNWVLTLQQTQKILEDVNGAKWLLSLRNTTL